MPILLDCSSLLARASPASRIHTHSAGESQHKLMTGAQPASEVLLEELTLSAYAHPSGVRDERFTFNTSPQGETEFFVYKPGNWEVKFKNIYLQSPSLKPGLLSFSLPRRKKEVMRTTLTWPSSTLNWLS